MTLNAASVSPSAAAPIESEVSLRGGTRIRVWLKEPPTAETGILSIQTDFWDGGRHKRSLSDICGWLCPTLDANLWVEVNGKPRSVVKSFDWKHLTARSSSENLAF